MNLLCKFFGHSPLWSSAMVRGEGWRAPCSRCALPIEQVERNGPWRERKPAEAMIRRAKVETLHQHH